MKSRAKKPAEPTRGRGRPRLYTPEEAAQRRREKAKEYAANRSPEQKDAARERARKWREENPDKVKAARERCNKGGRRPVVTPDKLRKARAHIAAGLTVREAAARLKIGKTALYKALENA